MSFLIQAAYSASTLKSNNSGIVKNGKAAWNASEFAVSKDASIKHFYAC
jgi:hypothetical protein